MKRFIADLQSKQVQRKLDHHVLFISCRIELKFSQRLSKKNQRNFSAFFCLLLVFFLIVIISGSMKHYIDDDFVDCRH